MNIEIYDGETLINTIVASESFAQEYCAANNYTYVILPAVTHANNYIPTADDDRDALLADLEYRVTLLELGILE